jgi:hypothetical protein
MTQQSALERFRSGITLDESDKKELFNKIISTKDRWNLSDLIYAYSYSFARNSDIYDICYSAITINHTPWLAATCLKALLIHWGAYDRPLIDSFRWYLSCEHYETYFDEILTILRFLPSDDGAEYIKEFEAAASNFITWANDNELLQDVDLRAFR